MQTSGNDMLAIAPRHAEAVYEPPRPPTHPLEHQGAVGGNAGEVLHCHSPSPHSGCSPQSWQKAALCERTCSIVFAVSPLAENVIGSAIRQKSLAVAVGGFVCEHAIKPSASASGASLVVTLNNPLFVVSIFGLPNKLIPFPLAQPIR
jgi:hypothetical protein